VGETRQEMERKRASERHSLSGERTEGDKSDTERKVAKGTHILESTKRRASRDTERSECESDERMG
jgi:hypothetical protein